MIILLYCIFGVNPQTSGELKTAMMEISKEEYSIIRDEEGNAEKRRLCKAYFGEKADLAWFEMSHY
jgi:hypothetical protein